MPDDRALSVRRALARSGTGPSGPREEAARTEEAEARLRAAVEAVSGLDLEIEALSAELDDFARRYERALGAEHAELAEAERVVRRLRSLEEALVGLAARMRSGEREARPANGRRKGTRSSARRRSAPPRGAGVREERDPPEPARAASEAGAAGARQPEVEPRAVRLKRVYRRLARLLHPDLAQDDAERLRLGDLMARVNAAYAKGDLTALEVMAEKLGAGEPPGDVSPAERVAHLERRTATMERFAASLTRERDRLRRSDTHRLKEEAARRAGEGGDLLEETRAELAEEIAAAWADVLARLGRLSKAARDVARARTEAMAEIQRRGPTGARRAFDPLRENEIVRAGAQRLDRRRATAAARDLARRLEEQAAKAPWDVALTVLAFLAEDAGARPPEALAGAAAWAAAWDLVREEWPEAPDLARMLARLPRGLALGARTQGEDVQAGVQLEDAELGAGVRIALEGEGVAAIARRALAALGPSETCPSCKARGPALHLLRTRGLDERHGLACASCGTILRSYWRYGEVDGLEALAEHALRLGLVDEVTVDLGGTSIGFQMLPAEREGLTSAGLRRRFGELYLAPYEIGLEPSAIRVEGPGGPLGPSARVGTLVDLRFTPESGSSVPNAEELLELLRARIERRFRP